MALGMRRLLFLRTQFKWHLFQEALSSTLTKSKPLLSSQSVYSLKPALMPPVTMQLCTLPSPAGSGPVSSYEIRQ